MRRKSGWRENLKEGMIMDKHYIQRRYHQVALEYQTAATVPEREQAMDEMAQLEQIAMQQYGFDYADMLHASEWGMQQ